MRVGRIPPPAELLGRFAAQRAPWDCAFALMGPTEGNLHLDVQGMVSPLRRVHHQKNAFNLALSFLSRVGHTPIANFLSQFWRLWAEWLRRPTPNCYGKFFLHLHNSASRA